MDKCVAPMFLAQKARYPSMRGRRNSVGKRGILNFARQTDATRQAQASAGHRYLADGASIVNTSSPI